MLSIIAHCFILTTLFTPHFRQIQEFTTYLSNIEYSHNIEIIYTAEVENQLISREKSQRQSEKKMCKSGILLLQIQHTRIWEYVFVLWTEQKSETSSANSNVSSCLHVVSVLCCRSRHCVTKDFPQQIFFSESITFGGNFLQFPSSG